MHDGSAMSQQEALAHRELMLAVAPRTLLLNAVIAGFSMSGCKMNPRGSPPPLKLRSCNLSLRSR